MQTQFSFLQPLETAVYLDDSVIETFSSFRDAVVYSWKHRRSGYGMNERTLQSWFCSNFGYTPSHFSMAVNEYTKSPMDLKADFIATFETVTGNRAVTQYCNRLTHTTSLEQIQAGRRAA